MSSEEELPDIPYCPLPAKKTRSDGEEAFLVLQTRFHQLLTIPAKNRSDDERKEYERLRKKYSKDKKVYPHLVEERTAATDAQRKAASRARMTAEERQDERDDARERMAQPEALAADRARKAQPEALAAGRARKAQPEARAATR